MTFKNYKIQPMKRIIYSCFLFALVFLSNNVFGQVYNATLTPINYCYDPAGNFGVVGITVLSPGATSYTFIVVPPVGGVVSQTVIIPPTGPSTVSALSFTGCGQYTLNAIAYQGITVQQQILLYVNITCPSSATISTPAGTGISTTLCAGATTTLTGSGGASYTWTPGGTGNGPTFTVAPLSTTCYTVNATTIGGCTVAPAVSCVTVQSINANISPLSQTICPGVTATLVANSSATGPSTTGIVYQWYGSPPASTLGTTFTQTDTPTASTTIYTVEASINTCTAIATATIELGTALSMTATADKLGVCPTESVTLTATSSATSYTWTNPLVNPSYTAFGNPVVATGPGIYLVQGNNGFCFGAASVTVNLAPATLTITASSRTVCAGENFTLAVAGGTVNSYQWAILNPLTSPPTPTALIGTPGANSVVINQVTQSLYGVGGKNAFGCDASDSITVFMTPNIIPTLVASSPSVCASSQVTLSASGGTLYTFVSSTGGTLSPSSTTSVITDNPTSATIYTVFATTPTGFCGGQAIVAVGMTVGGNLNITTTASAFSICPGQSSSLTASGALSYSWTPALTLSNVSGSTTIASPSITTVYTVNADNNGGCTGKATVSVFVSSIPILQISATSNAVCAGFTSTLTAQGAASYTWTGNTFAIPVNQASISVTSGTYQVIGGSAGANCPSLPSIFVVSVQPPLNIMTSVAPIQATTCITDNFDIKISKPVVLNVTGAATYAWFPYNPIYMTYSLGAQTTVRPPATTCYTVTGSTSVCSGTAIVCVNVIPQFTMNVVPPSPAICINDSIRLTILNVSPLAPTPVTYRWIDPSRFAPTITSQTSTTVTAFPQTTSTYTVEVIDRNDCISLPRLVTVTVLPRPITRIELPLINNVRTHTVCFVGDRPGAPDNVLDLTAINANIGLPFGVTPTYTWVSPYNPTSIVTSGNNPQVTTIAPVRLPALAVYTVVTGYNGIAGCRRVDTVTVRIIDCRPVVNKIIAFTTDIPKGDVLCARDCITFLAQTDTLAGGPQTYTWTFYGGSPNQSNLRNPVVCYDLPGEYDVVLTIRNQYPILDGGSVAYNTYYKYIKTVDYPNVTIVAPGQQRSDTTVRFGQSIVLTATNAATYTWTPNYSISALSGSIVTVNPTKTTQYIVTGSNSGRCFSSDTINVIVIPDCGDIFVPNAFSPNGDGVNDELKIQGLCLETLTFMIFNRWGEKVFETNDVKVGWDGNYHGEKLNTGVFVYRLEGKSYDGKGFSAKGNITLIR